MDDLYLGFLGCLDIYVNLHKNPKFAYHTKTQINCIVFIRCLMVQDV